LYRPFTSLSDYLERNWLTSLEGRVKILSSENQKVQEEAKALSDDRTKLNSLQRELTRKAENAHADLAQTFELCVTGALGFWASLGMLATWAIRTESDAEQRTRP
jgi:galactokinase